MLKACVIGVGSFGEKRAATLKTCKNVIFAGVSDIDAVKGHAVAEKLGVPFLSLEELWKAKDINAVTITIPNKYHMPVAIAAMRAGKHVLCEKPLARNVAEAEAMVKVAAETKRKLKPGSNHRYFNSVSKAYEIIQSGVIGQINGFFGRIGIDGERLKNSWFWDKEMCGGGAFLDQGCHLLDIARWFMGDFVQGTGLTTKTHWKQCAGEDAATGVFLTADGKIATIATSWRQLAGYFHFEVNGADGYITVDGRFDTHGGDNLYWQSRNGGGEIQSVNFGHTKPNSYALEMEAFFDAIEKGNEPTPSGKDGLAVLRMIEAVYKSKGTPIAI